MEQPFRLKAGGRIDRSKPLRFVFNGKGYSGYEGDTLASALIANGVHLVGRSLRHRRPRGLVGIGSEEPNAIVRLGLEPRTEPNARATQVPLVHGLRADPLRGWPGLHRDLGALPGLAAGILPLPPLLAAAAGRLFAGSLLARARLLEPLARRAACWGSLPEDPDPDTYAAVHEDTDVVVVGAGPAGLSAALAAATVGARVVLIDADDRPGGSLQGRHRTLDGQSAWDWIDATAAAFAALPTGTLLLRTTALSCPPPEERPDEPPASASAPTETAPFRITACERLTDHLAPIGGQGPRMRLWHLRCRRVILATGAHEQPLVFRDNDRPGIMLAGAARTYAVRWGAVPGRQAVVFTANDDAYEAAFDVQSAGVRLEAIIDARPAPSGPFVDMAKALGIPVLAGHVVTRTFGRRRITDVEAMPLTRDGRSVTLPSRTLSCDLLMISGGWAPALALYGQAGGSLAWSETARAYVSGDDACASPVLPRCVGSAAGVHDLPGVLSGGLEAGLCAAAAVGFPEDQALSVPHVAERDALAGSLLAHAPERADHRRPGATAFVDLQADVTVADLEDARAEGIDTLPALMAATGLGLGTDGGRTSLMAALALMPRPAAAPRPPPPAIAAPVVPVPLGALAGSPLDGPPLARPPCPVPCYPVGEESAEDAIRREALAGRTSALLVSDVTSPGPLPAAWIEALPAFAAALLGLPCDSSRTTLVLLGPRTPEILAAAALAGEDAALALTPDPPVAVLRCLPDHADRLIGRLRQAGKPLGLVHGGAKALDRLRLETGLPAPEREIDGTDQQPADLLWALRPDLAFATGPARFQLVGLLPEDPTAEPPEGSVLALPDRREPPAPVEGVVTSAGFSPHVGHTLALGLVRNGRRRLGETLVAPLPNGRHLPLRLVTPGDWRPAPPASP